MRASALKEQLSHTLDATDFPALGEKYQGKVRDTYAKGDRLVLITTDRLSAFDHVLTTLPFKGDLLNTLAHFWFQKTKDVVRNHVLDMPDPCVTVAKKAQPYPVEFVVRGYLTGSLWRDYEKGGDPYGLKLAPGIKKDSIFPTPLLTPSTKAPKGEHDLPLSEADIVSKGLLSARDLAEAKEATLALFAAGQAHAKTRGLILVDTKYEFGKVDGKLTLIDEMHTPDSSRFWEAKEYDARYAKGEPQLMLDKENLRQWLINERGFSGHGPLPSIPDDVRIGLTEKYLTAYERITGTEFTLNPGSVKERLTQNLKRAALT